MSERGVSLMGALITLMAERDADQRGFDIAGMALASSPALRTLDTFILAVPDTPTADAVEEVIDALLSAATLCHVLMVTVAAASEVDVAEFRQNLLGDLAAASMD